MKILAIDSCTTTCSVSLKNENEIFSDFIDTNKSSSYLLPMIDSLFNKANLKISDIDIITYTKGPGTFTGVRMCISCVQGLVLATGVKSIGISTLELLAYSVSKKFNKDKVAVAIDARMGEVYWANYDFVNNKYSEELLLKPQDVPILDDNYIGVGSGWFEYPEIASVSKVSNYISYSLNAENLHNLIMDKYLDKLSNDDDIQPVYLRNNVAQKKT